MTKSVRRQILLAVILVAFLVIGVVAAYLGVLGPTLENAASHIVRRSAEVYLWALERQNHFALLATVLAIIVGSYGTYKILINWNAVRRQLFKSYLEDEEQGIHKRKTGVSKHFQVAKKQRSRFNTSDINRWINDAITEFDEGKLDDARSTLNQLNGKLQDRIDFAAGQVRIAKKQQAAIHLFLGSIEAARFKSDRAVAEFQKTLALTEDQDADAWKYIAEQKLASSELESRDGVGNVHAQQALDAAQRMKTIGDVLQDKRIQSEAFLLQGRANLRDNSRTAGKDRANDGIREMEEVARRAIPNDDGNPHRDDSLNGQLRELLGDAHVLLENWTQADLAYAGSISFFQKYDSERAGLVKIKRARASQHEKDEASRPWPHPNGKELRNTSH